MGARIGLDPYESFPGMQVDIDGTMVDVKWDDRDRPCNLPPAPAPRRTETPLHVPNAGRGLSDDGTVRRPLPHGLFLAAPPYSRF